MANHCENLVKKLIEKIFKIPVANNTNISSQTKSSKY